MVDNCPLSVVSCEPRTTPNSKLWYWESTGFRERPREGGLKKKGGIDGKQIMVRQPPTIWGTPLATPLATPLGCLHDHPRMPTLMGGSLPDSGLDSWSSRPREGLSCYALICLLLAILVLRYA